MGRRGAALIRTGGDGSVGTTVGIRPAGEAETGSGAEAAGSIRRFSNRPSRLATAPRPFLPGTLAFLFSPVPRPRPS